MPKHPKDAKDFVKGTKYRIVVGHQFVGKFTEYVVENGITYAIFEESGRDDHGNIAKRKVDIGNILKIGIQMKKEWRVIQINNRYNTGEIAIKMKDEQAARDRQKFLDRWCPGVTVIRIEYREVTRWRTV